MLNSIQFIDHLYRPPLSKVYYGRPLYSSHKINFTCLRQLDAAHIRDFGTFVKLKISDYLGWWTFVSRYFWF